MAKYLYKALFTYIALILFFASVNFIIFRINPSAFTISDQFNKSIKRYGFIDRDIDLDILHQNAKDRMPLDTHEFCKMIEPVLERLDCIKSEISKDSILESQINDSINSMIELMNISRKDSIRNFLDGQLKEIKTKIANLKYQMNGKDTTELIRQGKYVELAKLKSIQANLLVDAQEKIIRKYGSFVNDKLQDKMSRLQGEIKNINDSLVEYENRKCWLTDTIRVSINAFLDNKINSVNFFDFIYYSICVSTTVSFGDIVPNNFWTRLSAITELLVCLVLVGLIIDHIKKRLKEPEEQA